MALNLTPFRHILDDIGGVATGVLNAGENLARTDIINPARELAAQVTGNQTAYNNAVQAQNQSVTNLAPVVQGITRTIPEALMTVGQPFRQASYTPNSPLEQAVFGKVPVQNIQAKVASTYTNHKNLSPLERLALAGGEGALSVAQDIPVAAAASKGAKAIGLADKMAAQGVGIFGGTTKAIEDAETAVPKPVPAPKASSLEGSVARIKSAIAQPFHYAPDADARPVDALNEILDKARSADQNALLQSDSLKNAIRAELPEDAARASVTHALEGAQLTAKTKPVTFALRDLYNSAYPARQAWDSNISFTDRFAPRFIQKAPKGAYSTPKVGIIKPISKLSDITAPIRSRHNLGRQVQKFVSEDGQTAIGKPSDLGLTQVHDGEFEDNAGRRWTPQPATVKEINASTAEHGYKFREDAAQNARDYMLDTMRGANRNFAAKQIINDPRFGLRQLEKGEEPGEGEKRVLAPGLSDYAAPKDVADKIESQIGFAKDTNIPAEVWRRASDVVTQFILRNPLIHGQNQWVQADIAAADMSKSGLGGLRIFGQRAKLAGYDHEKWMNLLSDMAKEGVYLPDYGKYEDGVLSHLTHGWSKYSSRGMASIDLHARASAYLEGLDRGLAPKQIAQIINHYLGDSRSVGGAAQNLGLFVHYLKTISRSLYGQVRHPEQHLGANIATAAITMTYLSLDRAIQKATGNPNANITPSGEIGLGRELVSLGKNVAKTHDVVGSTLTSGIVLNHTNPIFKEIIQQAAGQDLFTGKNIKTDRLGHAEGTLSGVAQQLGNPNKSIPEKAVYQLGRVNLPHAPGAPASPKIAALNTPGATPAPGSDKTGYQQMMVSINGKQKLLNQFAGDKRATDAINSWFDRNRDPKTGKTIMLTPAEEKAAAAGLSDPLHPEVLSKVQKYEQSLSVHNPMWDWPTKDLQYYLSKIKGNNMTDIERSAVAFDEANPGFNNGKGLSNSIQDISNWYNQHADEFGGKGIESVPGAAQYPQPSPELQSKLTALSGLNNPAQAAQFISSNPDLAEWLHKDFQYKNQAGQQAGGFALKEAQTMPPELQKALTYEESLPKGQKGKWIRANQDTWNQISTFLANSSLYNVSKEGAKNMYAGEQPSQTFLKDIKNLGTYDIVQQNGQYTINPSLAFASGGGGGGGSSSRSYQGGLNKGFSEGKKFAAANSPIRAKQRPHGSTKVKVIRRTPKRVIKVNTKGLSSPGKQSRLNVAHLKQTNF